MNEPPMLTVELDAMHAEAKAAFERRDLARYRDLFAPGLTYQRADGRVIGRDELIKDVAAQFRRLSRASTSFVREKIEVVGDRATETLIQTASVESTAFFVVHRTWELTRKGRYSWRKQGGRWSVEAVEVLEERVRPGRFRVGSRPPNAA